MLIGYVFGCPLLNPDCSCQMRLDSFSISMAGDTAGIELEAVTGNYWFWIAPNNYMPCGDDNEYVVEFDCGRKDRLCGNANTSGFVDIDEVVLTLDYIFCAGPLPPGYADANCSGFTDIDDALYLLDYIFGKGLDLCSDCTL